MTQLLAPQVPIVPSTPPPLEGGDHLNAKEFRRRYEAMPHVKKAELIRGVVYMPSPVRLEFHGRPHGRLQGWASVYEAYTPCAIVGDNSSVILDEWNEPQSDICLLIDPERGGQAKLVDGYLTGAPELVAEVAASSVSYDLHEKKEVYAEFGVREYIVWRIFDRAVDWFVLRDGAYETLAPDTDGVFRSTIFPGLWLASQSLIAGDLVQVHEVLRKGLADPSHAAFVASHPSR